MQNLPSSGTYLSGVRGSAIRDAAVVRSATTAVRAPSASTVRAIVVKTPDSGRSQNESSKR